MNEYDTIRDILSRFRRGPDPVNAPFESDAEFVRIGSQLWGLTLDEFSPAEDLFTLEDPRRLGSNLVTATLSDLLAAGVEPRFFLHALSLPRMPDPDFVRRLCDGMALTLDRAGCALCGGDLGTADPWRYTGFAMGPVVSPAPLTRRLPPEALTLWITGTLGDFNAAALTGQPTPGLELRLTEAAAAHAAAVAGIDTSGGLADALWMLHGASPGVRFEVDLPAIPYAAGVREICAGAGVPPEAALFGGAGEYELLFAFPRAPSGEFFSRLRATGFTAIGRAFPAPEPGVDFISPDGRRLPMRRPPPCPRSAAETKEHARQAVMAAAQLLSGRTSP